MPLAKVRDGPFQWIVAFWCPMSSTSDLPATGAGPEQPSFLPTGGNRKNPRRRITLRRAVIASVLVGAAVSIGYWWYRTTRPEYRFERGEEAIAANDWKTAAQMADRLQASGHVDQARLLRAELLYARKQPESAIEELNQIRDEGAIRLRAAALCGRCLLDLGANQEAERAFLFVISEDRDNIDAHRGLATIAFDLGQMNRALAHLEQVIRLDPNDARPHRMLAEVLREANDVKNAEMEYREALRIGNGLSETAIEEVRFGLVECLLRLRLFTEAVAKLDEFAAGKPETVAVQGARVEALRGAGRRQEAIAVADRALAEYPGGPFFRLRGQFYLEDGDAKAAIPLLERAVEMNPKHYQSCYMLAQAYAADNRKADAERTNAKAEALRKDQHLESDLVFEAIEKPTDPVVRLKLAELHERNGEPEAAARWRKAAAECQAMSAQFGAKQPSPIKK